MLKVGPIGEEPAGDEKRLMELVRQPLLSDGKSRFLGSAELLLNEQLCSARNDKVWS